MADELLAEDNQISGKATLYYDSKSAVISQVDPRTRRDRHELQQLLPKGLILDQQRSIPNCPYQMFDCFDRRLRGSEPIRRTIAIIDLSQTADESLNVLVTLAEQHLKGVAQPQEAARLDDHSAYCILPWFPAILADQIPAAGLSNKRLAWALLTQLMEGLAELHRHGLAHGNLRTASIALDTPTLKQESRVWLGIPDLDRVRCPTESTKATSPSRQRSCPEKDGSATRLERDDLAAIGRVAIELFAGASARRKLESTLAEGASITISALRNQMWWWRRRFLIEPLLTTDRSRFWDAGTVLARCQNIRQGERLAKQVALLVVITALLIVFSKITSLVRPQESLQPQVASTDSKRLDELVNSLNAAHSQLAEANTELEGLRRRNQTKATSPSVDAESRQLWQQKFAGHPSREYDQIRDSLHPKPVAGVQHNLEEWKSLTRPVESDLQALLVLDPQDNTRFAASGKAYAEFQHVPWEERRKSSLVQAVWRDALADGSTSNARIDSVVQVLSKFSNDNWLKNGLQVFSRQLLHRHAAWTRWEGQPFKLIEPWQRLIETPWDTAIQMAERERFLALQVAEKSWREVAGRGDLSWSEFKSQLKDAVGDNAKAAEVASVWIDQFNQLNANSKATVTLLRGHSPPGYGAYRTIDVHVGGSYQALDDELSGDTWDSQTDHVYPDSRKISFPWQPGQSIQVYVYGPRTVYRSGSRSTLIQRRYTGPIALWLMGQDQEITSGTGDNPHRLQFRVESCPGPPPLPAELEKLQDVIPY